MLQASKSYARSANRASAKTIQEKASFEPNLPVQKRWWKCSPCARKRELQCDNTLQFTHTGAVLRKSWVLLSEYFLQVHATWGDFSWQFRLSSYLQIKTVCNEVLRIISFTSLQSVSLRSIIIPSSHLRSVFSVVSFLRAFPQNNNRS
jgi:hypothetical protein